MIKLNLKKFIITLQSQIVNFHALFLSQHPEKHTEKNSKGAFVHNMAAHIITPFLFGRRTSYILVRQTFYARSKI